MHLVATKKDLLYTHTRSPAARFHILAVTVEPTRLLIIALISQPTVISLVLFDDAQNISHAPETEKKKKKNTLDRATVLSRRVVTMAQIDPSTRYTRLFKRRSEPRKTTTLL